MMLIHFKGTYAAAAASNNNRYCLLCVLADRIQGWVDVSWEAIMAIAC